MRVLGLLSSMRLSMEMFWKKLSEVVLNDNRSKLVFLINQYDLVLSVLEEYSITSSDDKIQLNEGRLQFIRAYIEEELHCYWKPLVHFVLNESSTTSNDINQIIPLSQKQNQTLENLAKDFSAYYSKRITQMHSDSLSFFTNFLLGSSIFKQALTQLTLYYSRFEETAKKYFGQPPYPPFLIPLSALRFEFQKYA
jgi:hypothetical protein